MLNSEPDPKAGVAGFQLSALSAYGGQPGAIAGVGFWPRVAARVIDLLAHTIVSFCAGLLFTMLLFIAAGGHPDMLLISKLSHTTFTSFVLALLGSIAYHTICEGLHGSTLGKLMLSMVVVREDGSSCGIGGALIRSLAYLVDALFFGLIGYFAMQKTAQEQRHGDEWAHTVVCKRANAPRESLRGGGRFTMALLFAMMADAALVMTGLLLNLST